MSSSTKINFEEALKEIDTLHGNMGVLSRLGPLLRDPNSDIGDVTRLIQSDGALSASIIRISNSAFYRSGEKNRDVGSALNKVGFNQALRLVGIALSKQVFMRDLTAYGISADNYWSYSYFSAVFMETVARRVGMNADDLYLLGLLHAIGRVLINEILHNTRIEMYWDPSIPSEDWEAVMVGIGYDKAGQRLLEMWNFEEGICKRVGHQLNAQLIQQDAALQLLALTRNLIEHNGFDFRLSAWKAPAQHAFYERSRSEVSTIEKEVERSLKQVREIRETLNNPGS